MRNEIDYSSDRYLNQVIVPHDSSSQQADGPACCSCGSTSWNFTPHGDERGRKAVGIVATCCGCSKRVAIPTPNLPRSSELSRQAIQRYFEAAVEKQATAEVNGGAIDVLFERLSEIAKRKNASARQRLRETFEIAQ